MKAPGWAAWILWLLIIIVVLLLLGVLVHALGGFNWVLNIGHFHWRLGVT